MPKHEPMCISCRWIHVAVIAFVLCPLAALSNVKEWYETSDGKKAFLDTQNHEVYQLCVVEKSLETDRLLKCHALRRKCQTDCETAKGRSACLHSGYEPECWKKMIDCCNAEKATCVKVKIENRGGYEMWADSVGGKHCVDKEDKAKTDSFLNPNNRELQVVLGNDIIAHIYKLAGQTTTRQKSVKREGTYRCKGLIGGLSHPHCGGSAVD